MGNEMREAKYWEEEERKICRLCGRDRERERERHENMYGNVVGSGRRSGGNLVGEDRMGFGE